MHITNLVFVIILTSLPTWAKVPTHSGTFKGPNSSPQVSSHVVYGLPYFSKLFCRKDMLWQGKPSKGKSLIDILTTNADADEKTILGMLKSKKVAALIEAEQIKSLQLELSPYLKMPTTKAISDLEKHPNKVQTLKSKALALGYRLSRDSKSTARELLSIPSSSSPWGVGTPLNLRESEAAATLNQINEAIEAFEKPEKYTTKKEDKSNLIDPKKYKELKTVLGTKVYKDAKNNIVYFLDGNPKDICNEDHAMTTLLERVLKNRNLKLSQKECEELKEKRGPSGDFEFATIFTTHLMGYDPLSGDALENAALPSIPVKTPNSDLTQVADALRSHYQSKILINENNIKEMNDTKSSNYIKDDEDRKRLSEFISQSIDFDNQSLHELDAGYIPAVSNHREELDGLMTRFLGKGTPVKGYETVLENGDIVIYPALRFVSGQDGAETLDKNSKSIRLSSQPLLKIAKENASKYELAALEAFYKKEPISSGPDYWSLAAQSSQTEDTVFTSRLSDLILHIFDCP